MSETITLLVFYPWLGDAMSAVAIAKDVFGQRGTEPDQRAVAWGPLLPLDEAAGRQHAARVEQDFGAVAPGVVRCTGDVLFRGR